MCLYVNLFQLNIYAIKKRIHKLYKWEQMVLIISPNLLISVWLFFVHCFVRSYLTPLLVISWSKNNFSINTVFLNVLRYRKSHVLILQIRLLDFFGLIIFLKKIFEFFFELSDAMIPNYCTLVRYYSLCYCLGIG